jgi:hypothetical protein
VNDKPAGFIGFGRENRWGFGGSTGKTGLFSALSVMTTGFANSKTGAKFRGPPVKPV